MARDYKNAGRRSSGGARPKAKAKPARAGLPGWLWLFTGLAIGLFAALLVHLYHLEQEPQRLFVQPGKAGRAPTGQAGGEPPAQQPPSRPRFEFYKLLPEQEVVVPEERTAETPRSAPPRSRAQPAKAGGNYLLQAGSFQKQEDAERLRANLALLGVEARIQRVRLASGETWHRVRIGPYRDNGRLNTARQRLQENGIETILLKQGG
ncbi:SPOR domain-containing protein [Alkalilimnicola sp. S0819]|uniref:SPOR domain-containing protein n=1 Tax=Alkalilimnicola sp. S0819 TaxID=2613922 RepID=UPI001261FBCF|nr:SPOR domain-containing protein [Alkalilimnicola sp. S0819]KAB7623985.1 SPOR domain-containing protein [Alkalilimnicola sp. S0819]MPQ16589.1 SPOR domain-containing protein [Alkalilimnicola sp. S0819]